MRAAHSRVGMKKFALGIHECSLAREIEIMTKHNSPGQYRAPRESQSQSRNVKLSNLLNKRSHLITHRTYVTYSTSRA